MVQHDNLDFVPDPTKIYYKDNGGHQIYYEYSLYIPLTPASILTENDGWVTLYPDGRLTFLAYYAWNGPSVPPFVKINKDSMRPSLIHDGLYQLMRQGKLDRKRYRLWVDKLFRGHLLEDGMSKIRAALWYKAVRLFASKSAQARSIRQIIQAP